jgi:hypothetical protein
MISDMNKKSLGIVIALAFIGSSLSVPAFAAVKAGATCKTKGEVKTVSGLKYACTKSGNKLVWTEGMTSSATLNLIKPTLPTNFDFSKGQNLTLDITVESNIDLDKPLTQLQFRVSSGQWTIPSQTRTIQGVVTQVSKRKSLLKYKFDFDLTEFDAIGNYSLIIEPFTSNSKPINLISNSKKIFPMSLTRNTWSKGELIKFSPLPMYEYTSIKNEKFSRKPWVGRNVTLLTYSPDLDPNVMARILNALDAAYDSYKEITQFSPQIYKNYGGKLSIAEMTPETIGCGGGCGYLGFTGIELQTELFMRLYNGVKLYDQFDEVLFYELGRNFWNADRYRNVLIGNTGNTKWFEINQTGFAVFMRYFVTEVNKIPIGANDGPNKPGLEYKNDMLNLLSTYRLPTDNFSSTFFNSKYSGLGFGANGLWSSLIYYFMPSQDRSSYVSKFLLSLQKQGTPNTIADSVNNVVKSIGEALGRDISKEFYSDLNFGDARSL